MDAQKNIKALVLDDEKVVRDFLSRFLSLEGIEVKSVENGFQAIEAAKKEEFDMIFIEVNISEVFKELKKIAPRSKYVIMSGYVSNDLLNQAENNGVSVCLKKPFEIDELKNQINEVRRLKENPQD